MVSVSAVSMLPCHTDLYRKYQITMAYENLKMSRKLLETGSCKRSLILLGRFIFVALVMDIMIACQVLFTLNMSIQSTELLKSSRHVESTQHIRKSETVWVNAESNQFKRESETVWGNAESNQFKRESETVWGNAESNQFKRESETAWGNAESNQFKRESETAWVNAESNQFKRESETAWVNAESNQFKRESETAWVNAESNQLKRESETAWVNAESNQFKRESETALVNAESNQFKRESETAWVNVGPEMFVFSAYLDTRKNYYYRQRAVVALAVQNIQMRMLSLYCLLTDSNGRTFCLKNAIRKVFLSSKQFKYRQYYYICNLPPHLSAMTPKFVSFSFNSSCQQPSPPVPVTQVQNTTNSTRGFGVCIQSPLFNMNDVQFIIQTIEMNRILGAEWFTFYIHSASQAVMRVLQDYSREGVVDVVMSTIPNISVQYYGQSVLIQDCAYRNMYKVRHLLYTDLDEIIVPQKHQKWSQMITAMDRKSIGGFHVRHVAFSGKGVPKMLSICNSSREIEIPRFMKFIEHSLPDPLTQRAKYIIKPETFSIVQIHGPGQLLKGYSTYSVPSEVALLYHYRWPFLRDSSGKRVKDDRMIRYLPELIERIEQRIC